MSTFPLRAHTLRRLHPGRTLAAALALALLAAGLAPAFDSTGASVPLAVAGGAALVGMALLAVGRYDAAVAVGLLLEGIVVVEPAPPDAAFAVIMAVAAVTGRFRINRVPRTALAFLSLLVVLNVLSMMDAVSIGDALRFFFITLYLVLFSVWLAGYVNSPERARLVVRSWLVIAAFSALIGVLAFNLPIPFRGSLLGDGGTRARAFFKDPNVYGPFLIPIAVIVLEERLRARTLRLRPSILGGLFVLLALGVVFSFSRAAAANLVLATVIMLGVHAARRRGARQAMRLLVGILLSLAVIAGILGATGSLGFLQQRAQLQSYDTNRFGAQHYGYELGWQYPVGVGPGQFKYHHPIETHSTYVRVLAEQGFLGLAAWIALALTTLVLALSNAVAGRDTYGIGSAALLGSWCGLLFNSAVVDTLHWRHLWLVAALIWAGSEVRRRAGAAAPSPTTV